MNSVRFNKKTFIKAISCILLVCSLLSCLTFGASSASMDELQAELDRLEKEQAQLASKINSIKNDKNKQQEYKNAIVSQVNNTMAQVNAYNSSLAALDSKIAETDAEIAAKDAELNRLKKEFKTRIRNICMNGGDSTNALLAVLLSAEDFADILTVAEYTKNLATYDEKVMRDIDKAVAAIKEKQQALEEDRSALDELKSALTEKEETLRAQLANANKVLAGLNAQQNQLTNSYNQLEKEAQRVEEEIRLAALGGSGVAFDGTFYWPLPGKKSDYRLTSAISAARPHPVYGTIRAHTGNDYAKSGIAGLPIYAAATGTVSIASNDVGGFGFYVMINHGSYKGSTYSTLYAHMTRYIVKQGQAVKKGDIIGYVGMSGAATGYHLHLEVRINGAPVNPDPYFK